MKTGKERHILLTVLFLVTVLVYLIPVKYLMPSIDDYVYADQILFGPLAEGKGLLPSILISVGNIYRSWQGNYFSFFILYFCAAVGGLDLAWVRFTVAVNVLLFFLSVFYLLRSVERRAGEITHSDLVFSAFYLLLVFCGLNRASPSEALYWLNASVIYTLPLALALFSVGNALRYSQDGRKRNLAASIALAVCAVGGVLMVTALLISVLFFLTMNEWLRKRKLPGGMSGILLAALAGGLVNALAPGNFVRAQTNAEGGSRIAAALRNTLLVLGERTSYCLRKEYLIWGSITIFLLLLFTAGGKREIGRSDSGRSVDGSLLHPVILWLEGALVLYLTMLPVIYGYNTTTIQPWRFCFVSEFLIAFYFLGCSGYTAYYIVHRCGIRKSTAVRVLTAAAVLLLFALSCRFTGRENIMLLNIAREFRNGQLADFASQEEKIIAEIEDSPTQDVVTDVGNPSSSILKDFNLKDDPDDYVNVSMARYYGKNSVRIGLHPAGSD